MLRNMALDTIMSMECTRCRTSSRFIEHVTQIYIFGENSWTIIHNFPCDPTKPVKKFASDTLN
jgi:hypothetical protein